MPMQSYVFGNFYKSVFLVMHICLPLVQKLACLRYQAIIQISDGLLLNGPIRINFSEI